MAAAQQIGSASYPVIPKNTQQLGERDAWNENLRLAALAASKVTSCLGPMGMYKLVTYNRGPELVAKVTKDAVDIVDELGVQYPAVKTLAEAAKIQREFVGDGVSTVLVLMSALFSEADKLVSAGVHPGTVIDGYAEAGKKSVEIINEIAIIDPQNIDGRLLEVVDCGRGILSKNLRDDLAEAVKIIAEEDESIDVTRIGIVKKPGGIVDDSHLVHGLIIKGGKAHHNMPDVLEHPKIALLTKPMLIKSPEMIALDAGTPNKMVTMTNAGDIHRFKNEEHRLRTQLVEQVKASGANVLMCKSKFPDRIPDLLVREGIFGLDQIDPKDLDEIARVTGAHLAANPGMLTAEDLGSAKRLEVEKLRPDYITILECDKGAALLLRGSNPELLQELEKIVKKALLVLKHSKTNPKIVPGGGALYALLATRLRKYALSFPGKQQLAIQAFCNALEKIPEAIARNYGLDPINTILELRRQHGNGQSMIGVGENGCTNMCDANVVELANVNKATLNRALEVVSLLLRIDSTFQVKELPIVHKR